MRVHLKTTVLLLLLLSAALLRMATPATGEGVPTIAAGGRHTCALNSTGGVQCWGRNEDGQLGDGTTTDSASPVDVVGLTEAVVDLAAGQFHTCAVNTNGGLQCWGRNAEGQLGDGAGGILDAMSATPVNVTGLGSGVMSVTAGWFHTCILTETNDVKCWGKNEDGQLGDGQSCGVLLCTKPVEVDGLPGVVATLAAGGEHSCVVTSEVGLKCWGRNNEGQLGDGTNVDRTTPVIVVGLSINVDDMALGGRHTCVVSAPLGGVKCWGKNDFGQLGDGTTIGSTTPVNVTLLAVGMADVEAGLFHTCARSAFLMNVRCWGRNALGQLGDGTTTDHTTSVVVQDLPDGVAAIDAGDHHSCAVIATDSVMCWGYNLFGQLGDGTSGNKRTLPVDVLGINPKPTYTATPTFTPTPTATPIPVGGIAKLPAVAAVKPRETLTSDSNAALTVATFATIAGVMLFIGATTYILQRRQ